MEYATLTLKSAFGPSGTAQKGTMSSSESRRGEAKAVPTSSEKNPIKINFVPVFIFVTELSLLKSLF
ncbi:MAG: hypothetical protein IBV52_01990 [Candidatus Bathyarchaeota archaeon]